MPKDVVKNMVTLEDLVMNPTVTKSNELVRRCCDGVQYGLILDSLQMRTLAIFISRLKPKQKEFEWQTYRIKELLEVLGISSSSSQNYYKMSNAIKNMTVASVFFESDVDNSIEVEYLAFVRVRLSSVRGTVSVRFKDALKPFLLNLQEHFTYYDLDDILDLKSSLTIHLFEYLRYAKKVPKRHIISVEDLKKTLGIESKYVGNVAVLKNTINKSLEEIKEKTGLKVTLESKNYAVGKTITDFKFIFEDAPIESTQSKIKKRKVHHGGI